MDSYNCSLREGYVPDLLKRSIINPLPKVSPPLKFKLTWELSVWPAPLPKSWKGLRAAGLSRKFRKILTNASTQGRGTLPRTPWFISYRRYMRQQIAGNVERECSLLITQRVSTLVDHSILLRELACFDIDTVLINWIRAFLTARSHAVRVRNSLSD